MDKYRRVQKQESNNASTPVAENEIRVTSQGRIRSTISYVLSLLNGPQASEDASAPQPSKKYDEIVLKGLGQAISKAITVAETVKRRVVGLHQITEISSASITDEWEPTEAGLEKLETKRNVSSIVIKLSVKPLDTKNVGYQPPLPADQVKPELAHALQRQGEAEESEENAAQPGQRRQRRPRGQGAQGQQAAQAAPAAQATPALTPAPAQGQQAAQAAPAADATGQKKRNPRRRRPAAGNAANGANAQGTPAPAQGQQAAQAAPVAQATAPVFPAQGQQGAPAPAGGAPRGGRGGRGRGGRGGRGRGPRPQGGQGQQVAAPAQAATPATN